MRKVIIIPPCFAGDAWFVTFQNGFHSSPYARCSSKEEAKAKAAEAKSLHRA